MDNSEKIIQLEAQINALKIKITELCIENTALRTENTELKQENAQLKHSLNQNSQNSSKPPSSDGLKKLTHNQSLRKKGRKKSGGQEGHKGHTLKQVSKPDHIISHDLSCCPGCKCDLNQTDVDDFVISQVFYIPLPKVEVTEHWAEIKQCPACKKCVCADFPDVVRAPVSYGQNIKSFAVYLQHQQLIPEDRL